MTTICWDGKEMAADSQSTYNGSLVNNTIKIFQGINYIMAFCGAIDEGYAFKAVLEGEMKNKDASISKDFGALVWWDTGVIEEYYDSLIPVPVIDKYSAMGTGAAVALTAMHCGKTAREAIEMAKKFDAFTSGKVISFSWTNVKKGKKKKKNEQLPADHIQEPVCEIPGGTESSGGLG